MLFSIQILALVLLIGHHPRISRASSSSCHAGCVENGGTCNEELARCDCPRHLTGPDCSEKVSFRKGCKQMGFSSLEACTQETPLHCLNLCSDRGKCLAGWCQCQPGHYGADCSLSIDKSSGKPTILAGLGYKTSGRKPLIYIYEVPPRYTTYRNIDKFDRPLHVQFSKRITSSGHRTTDGSQADYYYIPVDFSRGLFGEASKVLDYVRATWPYWNETQGHRHLLLSTSDLGGCEGSHLMSIRNLTAQSTWLTAWGLTRKHPRVWWPGCHRPGLDIVIPIPAQTSSMLRTPLNPKVTPRERNITFYFSGKICGDNQDPKPDPALVPSDQSICQTPTNPLYSAGMRQEVYRHHSKREGYVIVTRSKTYIDDMAASKFCLAPTGGGHGKRQVLVARFGCIPVPITDYVLQPFEPELDWTSFSVPVLEADVWKMNEILSSISDVKLAEMQKRVACASKHLWWSSFWGGIFGEDGRYDAFATVMEILRVRIEHPGTKPEDYSKVDERWRRFAACELEEVDGENKEGVEGELCTFGAEWDQSQKEIAPTALCRSRAYGKYGIPGGAICQGAKSLADCPRPGSYG